jgi:acetyl-CoA acetyltransferase
MIPAGRSMLQGAWRVWRARRIGRRPVAAAVAVVGGPDPRLQERACAVVVLPPDARAFTMEAMREFLAAKGVPQRRGCLAVVAVDEHPRATSIDVTRTLGLSDGAEHVKPNGGAIALGHPLGASGARLALTAALELHDRGARRALATMCIGVGQGIAVLFEAV